jgi:putative transcriptional regulator
VPSCEIFNFSHAADVQILSHEDRKTRRILNLTAARDWEQGRRQPECAARILLAMIAEEPETVKRVIGGFD